MNTLIYLSAFALMFAVAPAVAQAQYPIGARSGLYGLGGLRGLYGNGHFEKRPYFALNPPVYYSQPVARPYGYSPYALPPGVLPVEPRVTATPAAITNPFFTTGKAKQEKSSSRDRAPSFKPRSRGTVQPGKVQVNPFFRPRKQADSGLFTAVE